MDVQRESLLLIIQYVYYKLLFSIYYEIHFQLAFEEGLDDGKLTAENEHISTDGSYMDESFMRNDISDPFSNLQDSRLEGTSRDEDQYDVFGKFIANELRHMKFDHLRRKLKRQIQELVLKVSAEEDELHEHHSSIVPAVEMN